ncbi:MAG: zinc-ribbon domain-containing protein [Candidatus Devosia euplotis]|nr:zinc-ribbon domain-containing protein [Candidatus Devosia euplotis]
MIISCPHCQTKYQVTYEAIGSAGRKVQCAHCQQARDQGPIDKDEPTPEVRKAQEAIAEDGLDDAMSAQDKAVNLKNVKNAKAVEQKAAKLAKAEKDRAAKAAKVSKSGGVFGRASAGKIDPSVIRKQRRAFSHRQEKLMQEGPLAQLRLALRMPGRPPWRPCGSLPISDGWQWCSVFPPWPASMPQLVWVSMLSAWNFLT